MEMRGNERLLGVTDLSSRQNLISEVIRWKFSEFIIMYKSALSEWFGESLSNIHWT